MNWVKTCVRLGIAAFAATGFALVFFRYSETWSRYRLKVTATNIARIGRLCVLKTPTHGTCDEIVERADIKLHGDPCKDGFGHDIIVDIRSIGHTQSYTVASGGSHGAIASKNAIPLADFVWRDGIWIRRPIETPP
jgi:hypothetical protein